MCEAEGKLAGPSPSSVLQVAAKSSLRGSSDSKPAKKRKTAAAALCSDPAAIDTASPAEISTASETAVPSQSSSPAVSVSVLQLMRLAGDYMPSTNTVQAQL
jgi:hypothetical protein